MADSSAGASGSVYPLNDVDLLLIRYLQDDPRASFSSIARQTDIPETTVRRRIQALFDAGAVQIVALPRPIAVGYATSALVMVVPQPGRARAVAERLRDIPEVTYLSLTLGRYSIVCLVRATSSTELARVIHEVVGATPGIQQVESLVVSDVLKYWQDWRIPLAADHCREDTDTDLQPTNRAIAP